MNVDPRSTSGMWRKQMTELFPTRSTQQAEKQQFEISKNLGVSWDKADDWQSKVPVKNYRVSLLPRASKQKAKATL